MLWAFDDVIHHESIGKMDFLVGAKTVRGEEFVVEPVERVGLAIMIETHDVLVIDVIGGAGLNPLWHSFDPYSAAIGESVGRAVGGN
jgi:hypothetical protein